MAKTKKQKARKARGPETKAAALQPDPRHAPPPPRKLRAQSRLTADGGFTAPAPCVQPLPAKPSYKLVVVGPSMGGCIILDLLGLVQQRHAVDIAIGVPAPRLLTIVGASPQSLRAALAEIMLLEHSANLGHTQLFMIQASREQLQQVHLATDANDNPKWARFVQSDGCNPGRPQSHAVAFCSKLEQLTKVLRGVPRNIVMQAHLGRMMTPLGDDMSDAGALLGRIVDGTDSDKVIFDRKLGNGELFKTCRDKAISLRDRFFPCSSVAKGLDDVQPSHFLVVITAAFHIELEIGRPKVDSSNARLTRSRALQLVGSSGRADLTVACPSNFLDWMFEVIPELNSEDVPKTVADIADSITIAYPTPDEDFPVPNIPDAVLTAHGIKQVYGKTLWTVGCRGTPYLLELCRFHKFPLTGQAEGYQVSTGISVSSAAWADALKAPLAKGACRDLDARWSQVLQPRRDQDGIADFLGCMQSMVILWGGAIADSTPVFNPAGHNVPEPSDEDLMSFD